MAPPATTVLNALPAAKTAIQAHRPAIPAQPATTLMVAQSATLAQPIACSARLRLPAFVASLATTQQLILQAMSNANSNGGNGF